MSFMLSENGWRKAEKHLCPECWGENNWTTSDEPIFKQDDFQGVVILSVEEARAIRSKLCDLLLFAKGKDRYQSNVKKDLSLLWGRIIQAEGKCSSE